ncbi:styrene monooxygenase/indole monooxygenase family protein [Saccharopolyspora sp. NPDC000995]
MGIMIGAARSATIVGAGQGGLHLAYGLMASGWKVRLIADRTPSQYMKLGALSGHMLQQRSIAKERAAGIDVYDSLTSNSACGVDFALSANGVDIDMHFQGDFEAPAIAVDTRLKCSRALETFIRRKGNVVYHSASVRDLEEWAEQGDAVFVATGRGALSGLFELDEARTVYEKPQRELLLLLVRGIQVPSEENVGRIKFCFNPEHGELFYGPQVHLTNTPVYQVLIEARPGGAMDRFAGISDGEQALKVAQSLFGDFAGWEADNVSGMRLADPKAWLRGAVRPLVRKPVATLPSGRPVFGIGDVLMVLDPAAGQGGNAAAWGIDDLLKGLRELDDPVVRRDWYEDRFEQFWEREGRHFSTFSNMLIEPPNEAIQTLFEASLRSRAVADRLVSTFAHPKVLMSYADSVESAQRFAREAEQGVRLQPPLSSS